MSDLTSKAMAAIADWHRVEYPRPSDSQLRVTGLLKCRSVFDHPRFGPAMSQGAQALRRRLWTPRYISGWFDLTANGLRWVPADVHAVVGFKPLLIPWSELGRLVVKRVIPGVHSGYKPSEQGYVILEGAFGPPIEAQFIPFTPVRRALEKRGIRSTR